MPLPLSKGLSLYSFAKIDYTHLYTNEELFDKRRRELGEMGRKVLRRSHAGVQDIHVPGHADVLLFQPYVADHQHDFHAVRHGRGDLFQIHATHHDHTTAVGRQTGERRYVTETQRNFQRTSHAVCGFGRKTCFA